MDIILKVNVLVQKKCKECGSYYVQIGRGEYCSLKCWHDYLFRQAAGRWTSDRFDAESGLQESRGTAVDAD